MKPNTILIIIAACVVAAGAYWYFFLGSGIQAPLTVVGEKSDDQVQFQALVTQLQPVTFDTTVFSDARFLSLHDITTPVVDDAAGRIDPFAPIAGVSAQ